MEFLLSLMEIFFTPIAGFGQSTSDSILAIIALLFDITIISLMVHGVFILLDRHKGEQLFIQNTEIQGKMIIPKTPILMIGYGVFVRATLPERYMLFFAHQGKLHRFEITKDFFQQIDVGKKIHMEFSYGKFTKKMKVNAYGPEKMEQPDVFEDLTQPISSQKTTEGKNGTLATSPVTKHSPPPPPPAPVVTTTAIVHVKPENIQNASP